jgi:hypothetical protein
MILHAEILTFPGEYFFPSLTSSASTAVGVVVVVVVEPVAVVVVDEQIS